MSLVVPAWLGVSLASVSQQRDRSLALGGAERGWGGTERMFVTAAASWITETLPRCGLSEHLIAASAPCRALVCLINTPRVKFFLKIAAFSPHCPVFYKGFLQLLPPSLCVSIFGSCLRWRGGSQTLQIKS